MASRTSVRRLKTPSLGSDEEHLARSSEEHPKRMKKRMKRSSRDSAVYISYVAINTIVGVGAVTKDD